MVLAMQRVALFTLLPKPQHNIGENIVLVVVVAF